MGEPVRVGEIVPGVLDAIVASSHARKPLAVRADGFLELVAAITLESAFQAVRRRGERSARPIFLATIYPERFA